MKKPRKSRKTLQNQNQVLFHDFFYMFPLVRLTIIPCFHTMLINNKNSQLKLFCKERFKQGSRGVAHAAISLRWSVNNYLNALIRTNNRIINLSRSACEGGQITFCQITFWFVAKILFVLYDFTKSQWNSYFFFFHLLFSFLNNIKFEQIIFLCLYSRLHAERS